MPDNHYDLMILGAGPAGITAALYGQRLGLETIVFGDIPGGSSYMIEHLANFPGLVEGTSGTQFGTMAFQQAQNECANFTLTRLERLDHRDNLFIGVDVDGKEYTARSAIVATGRVPKRLAVSNLNLGGVHFCSICDGPLYRGKNASLAVVGSDNTAAQHALLLSRIAHKVFLICRSQTLKMDAVHKNQIKQQNNIAVMINTEVTGYDGENSVESIAVAIENENQRELAVDGLFLAIGWRPNSSVLNVEVQKTPEGYLKTDQRLMTSVPGLFAAGDVRDTDMWQVLTACADGARAAKNAAGYLKK
ncbi:MAG: FAD-dependent oxidoreductase [Deltaproteobacteria bacterium]|jgi:thioredoxin reductase (NADPH)|nr:FAD-dependent oxidoreductase [Deltaproteobacteria bacterium]